MSMKPIVCNNEPIFFPVKAGETYRWCSCGRAKEQPICDDSCAGTEFEPVEFQARRDSNLELCMCKQTQSAPYCDGHHMDVPEDMVGKEYSLEDDMMW